mgnify:FL=1
MALGTTGALIASAAISAASSTAGFIQAGKSKKEMKKAEAEADAALKAARDKLEINYFESLGIAKEPYELQREALLQSGAQVLQAGVEGETRGAASAAGRVLMAQQAAQNQQRANMSREIQQLKKLAATEESRLQQQKVNIDLEEVKGAQQAAAEYEAAMRASQQGAVKSAAQALTSAVAAFSQNPFDVTGGTSPSGDAPSLGTFSGKDYSTFGEDILNFDPMIPNLTNDPFYQFMQPGVTAPTLS